MYRHSISAGSVDFNLTTIARSSSLHSDFIDGYERLRVLEFDLFHQHVRLDHADGSFVTNLAATTTVDSVGLDTAMNMLRLGSPVCSFVVSIRIPRNGHHEKLSFTDASILFQKVEAKQVIIDSCQHRGLPPGQDMRYFHRIFPLWLSNQPLLEIVRV